MSPIWNTENPNLEDILSREAAVALEANRFVKDIAGGKVTYTGAGEAADGVTRNAAAAGEAVAVQYGGDLMVEAGAAVADRAAVTSGANGVAVTAAVGNSVNGDVTNGTSAGAAGDLITIRKRPKGIATA